MSRLDDLISDFIETPYSKYSVLIGNKALAFEDLKKQRPTDISGYKKYLASLSIFKSDVDSIKFDLKAEPLADLIEDQIKVEQEQWLEEKSKAYSEIDAEIDEVKAQIETENKEYNDSIIAQNNADNKTYNEISKLKDTLYQYSNEITNVCNQYGISTSDFDIDITSISKGELVRLYKEYINYIEKHNTGTTTIIEKFMEKCPNTFIQLTVFIVVFLMCMSRIGDFVSIGFFGYLVYFQVSSSKRVKYFAMLQTLAFNVKPEQLGYVPIDKSLLKPASLSDDDIDNDERFSGFEQKYDEVDARFADSDPMINLESELTNYKMRLPSLNADIKKKLDSLSSEKSKLITDIDTEISEANEVYDKLKSEYEFLGRKFTNAYVLNTNYIFGLDDQYNEEFIDIGMKNVIIRGENDPNMASFIRAMIVNTFCNVQPDLIHFDIVDPNESGKIVMPLFQKDLEQVLTIHTDDIKTVAQTLEGSMIAQMKNLAGKSIVDYNAECEKSGVLPLKYNVTIVLSQAAKSGDDEALNKLFEYSAESGFFLWIVSDTITPNNTLIISKPFDGIIHPIYDKLTSEWCRETSDNIVDAISKVKPKGLPWGEFVAAAIPDDKVWHGNIIKARKNPDGHPDNNMEIFVGFQDGDPNKFQPYELGNTGNVHALTAGGTGSGKSVFLNDIICNLTRQYSPYDLELWLADFKGSEFISYLPTEVHPWILPHIKACLCTSDADFATSLFKALRDEADLRYNILKSPMDFVDDPMLHKGHIPYHPNGEEIPNAKDAQVWNSYWRQMAKDKNDDNYIKNCWPRIYFLADEFQVIFQKAEGENLESIKADITQLSKVARAANVNLHYASQSMQKTLSQDILDQYSLRICLKVDSADVSSDMLGNPIAASLKTYGLGYARDSKTDKEHPPLYKIPYFLDTGPGGDFYKHIQDMDARAKEIGYHKDNVITYSETDKYFLKWTGDPNKSHKTTLEETYNDENVKKLLPDYGVFFLGSRMKYDPNQAPDNIIIGKKDGSNIMSVFSQNEDMVMFYHEMIYNIKRNKKPGVILANAQVHNLGYICGIDRDISNPDVFGKYIWEDTKCLQFANMLEQTYNSRKEHEEKRETPVWIFLVGWDKADGFGVNVDFTLKGKMNTLMQTAGSLNMHFIFICSSVKSLNPGIIAACDYKIAGKVSKDDSFAIFGNKIASKLYSEPGGYIFSFHNEEMTRDKLYISEIDREVEKTEIVLS